MKQLWSTMNPKAFLRAPCLRGGCCALLAAGARLRAWAARSDRDISARPRRFPTRGKAKGRGRRRLRRMQFPRARGGRYFMTRNSTGWSKNCSRQTSRWRRRRIASLRLGRRRGSHPRHTFPRSAPIPAGSARHLRQPSAFGRQAPPLYRHRVTFYRPVFRQLRA